MPDPFGRVTEGRARLKAECSVHRDGALHVECRVDEYGFSSPLADFSHHRLHQRPSDSLAAEGRIDEELYEFCRVVSERFVTKTSGRNLIHASEKHAGILLAEPCCEFAPAP